MPLSRIAAPPQGFYLSIPGLRGASLDPAHLGLLAVQDISFGMAAARSGGNYVAGYSSERLTLTFDTDQGLTWFINSAAKGTNVAGSLFGGGIYGTATSYADSLIFSISQARVESVSDLVSGGFIATLVFSSFDFQARDLQGNGVLAPASRFGSNNLGTDTVLSVASATAATPVGHTAVPTSFYFTASGLAGPLSGGGLTNLFEADVQAITVNKSATGSPTVSTLKVTLTAGEESIDGILTKLAARTAMFAEVLGYSNDGQVYKLSINNATFSEVDLSKPGQVTLTLNFSAATTWRTIDVDDLGRPVRYDTNTANFLTNVHTITSGTITSIPANFVPVAASTVATPDRFFVSVAGWRGDTASGLHTGLFEAATVSLPTFTNSGTALQASDVTLAFATQDGAARFFDAMASNAALPAVTIYESATGSAGLSDVFQFDLANAKVSSVTNQGGRTVVTLSFAAFEATAFPRDANGNSIAPVQYGFTLATGLATTVADAPASMAVPTSSTEAPISYYITIPGIAGNHPLQFQNAGTVTSLLASSFNFGGFRSGTLFSIGDVSVQLAEGMIYLPKLADWAVSGLNLSGAKIFGYSAQGLAFELDLTNARVSSVYPNADGSVGFVITPTQYAVHVFNYGAGAGALIDETFGYNRTGSVVSPYVEVAPLDQSAPPTAEPTITLPAPEKYYLVVGGWTGDSDSALHSGLFEVVSPYLPTISNVGSTPSVSNVTVQFATLDGLANFVGALASSTRLAQAGLIGSGLFGGITERDSLRIAFTDVTVTAINLSSQGYQATIAYRTYDFDTRGLDSSGNLVTVVPHQGYNIAADTRGASALSNALNTQPTDGSNNAAPTRFFLQLNGISGTFSTSDTASLLPIEAYSFGISRGGTAVSNGAVSIVFNSSIATNAELLRLMTDATLIGQGHIFGYNSAGQVFDLALASIRIAGVYSSAFGITELILDPGSFTLRTVDLSASGTPVRSQTAGFNFATNTATAFVQTTIATLPAPASSLNSAPLSQPDNYVIDGSASIGAAAGVLANDSDPDGNALLAPQITTPPGYGAVTLRADGSFDFTTTPNFSGYDSFQYRVSDAFGAQGAPVSVNLTVYLAGATAGDDVIIGTAAADLMRGLGGKDTLSGGDGNDTIYAEVGDISVAGGNGTDTIVFGASGTLTATLSGFEALVLTGGAVITFTGAQITNGFSFNSVLSGTGSIIVNLAATDYPFAMSGMTVAGGSNLAITINGTASDDYVKGVLNATNTLIGGDGFDFLRGGLLNDVINGGNDNDKIIGWLGADTLTGGAGADQFRFFTAGDSGFGAARDVITDFVIGTDFLDFRLLDPDPVTPGYQHFSFIGTAAFVNNGTAQLRYFGSGADLLLQVDADGNGVADMEVVLQGLNGQTLTAGDFLL